MTPERLERLRSILNRRQPDLTVICDEVHKGRNLSAIVRSCDAAGIGTVHCAIPQRGFRAFQGTAMGSHKWVEHQFYDSVAEPIQTLKRQGHQIVAANLSDRAAPFWEVDYTRPTALLLGTEKEGVSDLALSMVDREVVIPMQGMVESYNVSAACTVILVEAQRQRLRAGLYERQRLEQSEWDKLFFQWAHPVITEYCHKHKLPYPKLDDEGEIIEPAAWYRQVRELQAQT